MKCYLFNLLVMLAGMTSVAQAASRAILDLHPAGYWPANEGSGDVLKDYSGGRNDAKLVRLSWKDGLLDFSSAYQWVEIASQKSYQEGSFSMGGWLFTRRSDYEIVGHGKGMLFFGNSNGPKWGIKSGAGIVIGGTTPEVFAEAGGTRYVSPKSHVGAVQPGVWTHLFYTYHEGSGRLYINGNLISENTGVRISDGEGRPFYCGTDNSWWMVHRPPSRSLDGSIRELVIFSRALSSEEVLTVSNGSRPEREPYIHSANGVRLPSARTVSPTELAELSGKALFDALKGFEKQDPRRLQVEADALLPVLKRAVVGQGPNRIMSVRILKRINTEESITFLQEAKATFVRDAGNDSLQESQRASAVMALAAMKGDAKDALPKLCFALDALLGDSVSRMPRVEETYRNALIRAMVDIDPGNAQADTLLDRALPKGAGRYLSQGDELRDSRWGKTLNEGAYTSASERNGVRYTLHSGVSFDAAEPVPPDEFKRAVRELEMDYPHIWLYPIIREGAPPNLYRVRITRSGGDARVQSVFLEGENFIFEGSDAKVRGWSIAVDKAGFLHLVGGQHNVPYPEYYIPGSWEKIGISRDRNAENFPSQMYWVSEKPEDITTFKFSGQKNNPRRIVSPDLLNYMSFVHDRNGELYLYGRIGALGQQTFGLYHYDTEKRLWNSLGGKGTDVLSNAVKKHPGWENHLTNKMRGGELPDAANPDAMVWAWQPHFYNYARTNFGIQFDKTNRMHFLVPIRGLDVEARVVDRDLYAWSDDGGKTFFRADGTPVQLPLTVNPALDHDPDPNGFSGEALQLWLSLLEEAGYERCSATTSPDRPSAPKS